MWDRMKKFAYMIIRRKCTILVCIGVFGFILHSWMIWGVVHFKIMLFEQKLPQFGNHSELDTQIPMPKGWAKRQRIVHYLWCEKEPFQFQHYLSMLSSVKFLHPDKIVFHYAEFPVMDKFYYHRWLQEFGDEYPYLEMRRDFHTVMCDKEERRRDVIKNFLSREDGLYVGHNTLLARDHSDMFSVHSVDALRDSSSGFMLSPYKDKSPQKTTTGALPVTGHWTCVKEKELVLNTTSSCIFIDRIMFPKDIMTVAGRFGELCRTLFYGKREPPNPVPYPQGLVPNIGHMLWVGGGKMDYVFYLSCLSLLFVVNVDSLYIHGDAEPSGKYWSMLKAHVGNRLIFVRRPTPDVVFGHKTGSRHHMSDIFRVDVMLKYGGIYSDVDVVWVQPLDTRLRSYDAVATFDWPHWYPPYPDYINFGASLGKRNAPFWRLFGQSMRIFRDDIFGFNGLLQPYKVYERHPDLLYIYDHLQVLCFRRACHPTWPGARPSGSWDWRKDTHAVHWTHPNPWEFRDQETLLNSTGTWADIGKYVLQKAGIIT